MSAWLAQPGTGAALYSLMSADHATLESAEAGQDARGGALAALQAKLLNMNHEDFLLKVCTLTHIHTRIAGAHTGARVHII